MCLLLFDIDDFYVDKNVIFLGVFLIEVENLFEDYVLIGLLVNNYFILLFKKQCKFKDISWFNLFKDKINKLVVKVFGVVIGC